MEALCIVCLTILALASMYFASKDNDKDIDDKKKRRTKDEK